MLLKGMHHYYVFFKKEKKDKEKNKYNVGVWMRAYHLALDGLSSHHKVVRCGKHACNLSLGLGVKHNLRLEQTK